MLARQSSLLILGAALLAACAPDQPAPVDTMVVVFNPKIGRYEPRRVKLRTVEDVTTMTGSAANIIGGGHVRLDVDDAELAQAGSDPNKIRTALVKDEGAPVEVAFIETDGLLVPSNFHSLNITTTYYNLERSFDFFDRIGGMKTSDLGTPDVYYFPKFEENLDGSGLKEQKDNAFFISILPGLLILPFEDFQQIPFSINTGIVAHEFSHAVFHYRVHDKHALPPAYEAWSSNLFASPGMNLLRSLDEGFADFFGTGVTCSDDLLDCSVDFMADSINMAENAKRRIGTPHCLSAEGWEALESFPSTKFDSLGLQYPVGSVLSSSLWRATVDPTATGRLGPGELRRQVYEAAYRSLARRDEGKEGIRELVGRYLGDAGGAGFRLYSHTQGPGVLQRIVESATDDDVRRAMCAAFLDQFDLKNTDIPGCEDATANNDC